MTCFTCGNDLLWWPNGYGNFPAKCKSCGDEIE